MNNQSVSLVPKTNIKQDRQKIWQPTVGEVLVVLKTANKQESPPLLQTKKIVCIEQIVGRPYVPCDLDLRSPRYSVLQPLLETPISTIVFILQPEVMFVGVVMIKT